jgi:hypothetical protein
MMHKANPRRGSEPMGACKWMAQGEDLENLGVTPRTARASNREAVVPASSNDVQCVLRYRF